MNCYRFEEILSEYVEDLLSIQIRREAERHIESCPSCRRKAEELRELLHSMKTMHVMTCSKGFEERLKSRIAAHTVRDPERLSLLWGRWSRNLSAAAAVLLFMGAGYLTYDSYFPDTGTTAIMPPAGMSAASGQTPVDLSRPSDPVLAGQSSQPDSVDLQTPDFNRQIRLVNDTE